MRSARKIGRSIKLALSILAMIQAVAREDTRSRHARGGSKRLGSPVEQTTKKSSAACPHTPDRGRPADRGNGANVVVSRFADHQPLYRQSQMMDRWIGRGRCDCLRRPDASTNMCARCWVSTVTSCNAATMLPTRPCSTSRRRGPSKLAFCRSHVRRNFHDLANGGAIPTATGALQQIARLYQIETDIRGLSAPNDYCASGPHGPVHACPRAGPPPKQSDRQHSKSKATKLRLLSIPAR